MKLDTKFVTKQVSIEHIRHIANLILILNACDVDPSIYDKAPSYIRQQHGEVQHRYPALVPIPKGSKRTVSDLVSLDEELDVRKTIKSFLKRSNRYSDVDGKETLKLLKRDVFGLSKLNDGISVFYECIEDLLKQQLHEKYQQKRDKFLGLPINLFTSNVIHNF